MTQGPYNSPWRHDASLSVPICDLCRRMLLHQADYTDDGKKSSVIYSEDVNATQASLRHEAACSTCQYAWAMAKTKLSLSEDEWNASIIRHAVSTTPSETSNTGTLQYDLLYPSSPKKRIIRLVLEVQHLESAPKDSFWQSDENMTPIERLSTARKWLFDCQDGHAICRGWQDIRTRRCPTRLIDVSGSALKLVCPAHDDKFAYAALSHCWGDSQLLQTTGGKLKEHMNMIALQGLPRTFQDAVVITRELGIHYIWIDSLCIVQDDASDWQREAANMAITYENATITLAAAWGRDGGTGMFTGHVRPLVITIDGSPNNRELSRNSNVRLTMRPRIDEGLVLRNAPLNTRKWVLQERLLSPRTLSFARDQMHWICPSLQRSEDGLTNIIYSMDNANYSSIHFWETRVCDDVDAELQLHESWELVVSDHSRRNLTFAKDKLATLAGVTEAFERIFSAKALLGLWQEDIARTLLWETEAVTHSTLDNEAIEELNLPSWTWLRINGSVRAVAHYGKGPLLEITNTKLVWSGLPMTSRITEASIEGSGKLLPISRVEASSNSTCMCNLKTVLLKTATSEREFILYTWSVDVCYAKLPDDLYCLFLYDGKVSTRWSSSDDPVEACCLLLHKHVDQGLSYYTRLGVMTIKDFPQETLDETASENFVLK